MERDADRDRWFTAEEAREYGFVEEIVRLRTELELILSRHTGQPFERLREDTGRDLVLNAQEALAYGLVDGVLDSRKTVPAA